LNRFQISIFCAIYERVGTWHYKLSLMNVVHIASSHYIWLKYVQVIAWFRVQFGYNMHEWVFKDLKIARVRRTSAIWGLWKTHECMFIQISRETMLLLIIIYIKMFETIVVLTYAFIANIPLANFPVCYITLYNANSLKIPLNYICNFC
jgi:hypothetical protein